MTFVFWWPVLYGLVLLAVLVLWVKTDDRNQKTGVGNRKSENRSQENPVTALRGARRKREAGAMKKQKAERRDQRTDNSDLRPLASDFRGARRTRASGRDVRETTSIRREASLFDWGPGSAPRRALSRGPKPRAPRPHFFLFRHGVRRTPVAGGRVGFIELGPRGRPSAARRAFSERVRGLGARYAEAHSIEEVARILRTWGLP